MMAAISIHEHYHHFTVTLADRSITTILTNSASVVEQWISVILLTHKRRLSRLIVGLDLEWRPSLYPLVALLQLCVGRRCLIFQLIHADSIPQALIDFLANPTFRFVGVGIDSDVEKLLEGYNLGVARCLDLRHLAAKELGMKELASSGLKTLARVVLGLEVDKPKTVTLSRWDQVWLTRDQVQYACVDAYLSFEIGRDLISRQSYPILKRVGIAIVTSLLLAVLLNLLLG